MTFLEVYMYDWHYVTGITCIYTNTCTCIQYRSRASFKTLVRGSQGACECFACAREPLTCMCVTCEYTHLLAIYSYDYAINAVCRAFSFLTKGACCKVKWLVRKVLAASFFAHASHYSEILLHWANDPPASHTATYLDVHVSSLFETIESSMKGSCSLLSFGIGLAS